MEAVDRAFLWVRSCMFCHRFALFTRLLLAAAFLPTGMVKLMGERFTLIAPGNPIGDVFEALYQTGLFWRFIGAAQVAAALLLLVPRLAHLGAALFLPIVVNIFVLTVALDFRGTPFITGPMVLAVLFLVAWDWHRFRSLVTTRPLDAVVPQQRLDPWERLGFTVFGLSLVAVLGITRDLFVAELARAALVTGFAAGLFTLGRFLWVWRQRPVAS